MVAPLVIAAGVGAGLGVGGNIYGGIQAKKDFKKQARSLEDQARLEEEASQFDALQTSKQFESLLGEQELAVAASGAEREGSVLDIFNKTIRDKQTSVANIIATGRARAESLKAQAAQAKKAGRRALTSSIISGVGHSIQSGSSIYSQTR